MADIHPLPILRQGARRAWLRRSRTPGLPGRPGAADLTTPWTACGG